MDDVALIALMERLDNGGFREWPHSFDHGAAMTRFLEVARLLQAELSCYFEPGAQTQVDTHVEDAGFHAEVELIPGGKRLRFSNFGDLVAMHEDEEAPKEILAKAIAVIETRGYIYVPFRLLQRPYPDGLVEDWWTRHFDYF
jgi:hypothetical protein